MSHWLYIALTIALIFTDTCNFTGAQSAGKGERISKLAPELVALHDQYSNYTSAGSVGVFRPRNPLVQVIDDRVAIDAVASGDTEVLRSDLVSLGMQNPVAFGRIVSGQLPIDAIPAMGALASLQFARAATVSTRGRQSPGH